MKVDAAHAPKFIFPNEAYLVELPWRVLTLFQYCFKVQFSHFALLPAISSD